MTEHNCKPLKIGDRLVATCNAHWMQTPVAVGAIWWGFRLAAPPKGPCKWCKHDGDFHTHHRAGTDCSLCGCRSFRR